MVVMVAPCSKPGCRLPAVDRGRCVEHNAGQRDTESAVLRWYYESAAARAHRRATLAAIDDLIDDIEALNLRVGARRSVPGTMLSRFRLLGGVDVWMPHFPSGHQLHAACLVLQETLMREPCSLESFAAG